MKKILLNLLFVSLFICSGIYAQTKSFDLIQNHQALLVKDLKSTGDFYLNILGFTEIEAGAGQIPPKRWFKNSEGKEMHLIHRDSIKLLPKGIHMAYSVDDISLFTAHLKKNNVFYGNWASEKGVIELRKDGVKQIWLQDPSGYWIEINQARN